MAYDSASPGQKTTAVVTIVVTRNENGPTFTQSNYAVQGPETVELGAFVAQVNATDLDGVSHIPSRST